MISGPGKVMEIDVVNQTFSGNAQVIYLHRKYFFCEYHGKKSWKCII